MKGFDGSATRTRARSNFWDLLVWNSVPASGTKFYTDPTWNPLLAELTCFKTWAKGFTCEELWRPSTGSESSVGVSFMFSPWVIWSLGGHCQSLLVRSSQKPTWNPKMDSVWRNLHIYMFTGIVLIYIYIKHICTTCRSKTYPVEVHYARMLRKPKVNSERAAALPKRGHRMTKTHPAHMVSCELRVWVELFQRV